MKVTGGLRRYHEHQARDGRRADRDAADGIEQARRRAGGNRITLQRLRVPLSVTDPIHRIRAIEASCRATPRRAVVGVADTMAGALNLVPTAFVGAMLKHVDFLASDVTGFRRPIVLSARR